jgi:hypothetical protein
VWLAGLTLPFVTESDPDTLGEGRPRASAFTAYTAAKSTAIVDDSLTLLARGDELVGRGESRRARAASRFVARARLAVGSLMDLVISRRWMDTTQVLFTA